MDTARKLEGGFNCTTIQIPIYHVYGAQKNLAIPVAHGSFGMMQIRMSMLWKNIKNRHFAYM